jgi:hypothetical protein
MRLRSGGGWSGFCGMVEMDVWEGALSLFSSFRKVLHFFTSFLQDSDRSWVFFQRCILFALLLYGSGSIESSDERFRLWAFDLWLWI